MPTTRKPNTTQTYLYRFTELDDEGDPIDHGIMTCRPKDIERTLRRRMQWLGHAEEPGDEVTLEAYVYPMQAVPEGMWEVKGDRRTVQIHVTYEEGTIAT